MSGLVKRIVGVIGGLALSVILVSLATAAVVANKATESDCKAAGYYWYKDTCYDNQVEALQAQVADLTATLTALQQQLVKLQAGKAPAGPAITGCTITSFDRDLKQGMIGDDVKCLQIVLNSDSATQVSSEGPGSPGNETTYFGPLTKAAVIKFQEKYAADVLTPIGLTAGTGFVGAKTRAKLNSLLAVAPSPKKCQTDADCDTGYKCVEGSCVKKSAAEITTKAECTAVGYYWYDEACNEKEKVVPKEPTASLAPDTPAAAVVAKGAQDLIFTKIKFTAAAKDLTISSITVTRSGVSEDNDVTNIKLYDGTIKLGATQVLNVSTHSATFSGLNWTIPVGESRVLTIKGTIDRTNADPGNTIKLGIAEAGHIVATEAITGEFPLYGYAKTVASLSAGKATTTDATPGDTYVLIGATEQLLNTFRFQVDDTESAQLTNLTLTLKGTCADTDVKNIKLFWGGAQVGETVPEVDANSQASFDLSKANVRILKSSYEDISVYADIKADVAVDAGDTAYFVIDEADDVSILGQSSGGFLEVKASSWPVSAGYEVTFKTGQLKVTLDPTLNPSDAEYVKGSKQRVWGAYRFSTSGSMEGVKIERIKFTKAASAGTVITDTELSNIKAYVGDNVVAGPASFSSGVVTLIFSPTFDIPKGQNKTLVLKGDISGAAVKDHQAGLYINAKTDLTMKGLESDIEVPLDQIDISAVDTIGEVSEHKVLDKGTLSVDATGISLTNVSPGTEDFVFAKFTFTAGSGEDVLISKITIKDATGTNAIASDLSSIEIFDGETKLGATVNEFTPVSGGGTATFYPNWTIPAGRVKTLTVKADVDTGISVQSTGETHRFEINAASDLTVKGVTSAETIAAGGTFPVQAIPLAVTIVEGSLTVNIADTPVASTYIKGETDAHVATIYLKAGPAEDVKVTYLKLNVATSTAAGASPASTKVANLRLYKGATQIGSTITSLVDGASGDYCEFKNIENLTIAKGTTAAIDVKVKVADYDTANNYYFGIAADGDVRGIGVSSGKDISSTGSGWGKAMTFSQTGQLYVWTKSTYTPGEAIHALGTTGAEVDVLKWKAKAINEGVMIANLVFDVVDESGGTTNVTTSDFASAQVYLAGSAVGPVAYPETVGNGNAFFTFTFVEPPVIAKNTVAEFALRVKINGIDAGAFSGHAAKFGIHASTTDSIVAKGAASSQTVTVADEDGSGWTEIVGNAQILRKSVPTINLAADTPSGTLLPGAKTPVLKFTVKANAGDVDLAVITVKPYMNGDVTGGDGIHFYNPDGSLNVSILNAAMTTTSDTFSTTTADQYIDLGNVFGALPAGKVAADYFQVGEIVDIDLETDTDVSDAVVDYASTTGDTISLNTTVNTPSGAQGITIAPSGYKSGYQFKLDITDYPISAGDTVTFTIKADTTNATDDFAYHLDVTKDNDTSLVSNTSCQRDWDWCWYDGKKYTNAYKVKELPLTGKTLSE
ncbi:MAG: peptidoglycan-binding protein [Patescibacteria group bacterium]|nr:peptidoglycan-binding protein [Patescibacteria group bacterium]